MKIGVSDDAGLDGFANVIGRLTGLAFTVTTNDGKKHDGELHAVYDGGLDEPFIVLRDTDDPTSTERIMLAQVAEMEYS